jgi:hypothetical protein
MVDHSEVSGSTVVASHAQHVSYGEWVRDDHTALEGDRPGRGAKT